MSERQPVPGVYEASALERIEVGACPTCGGMAQFIAPDVVRHVQTGGGLTRETVARMMGEIYVEGLRMAGYEGKLTGWNETWPVQDRTWVYQWVDSALSTEGG